MITIYVQSFSTTPFYELLPVSIINTDMCWVSWNSKHDQNQNHQKRILKFDTLPWQQYFRYHYSIIDLHRPWFDIIVMTFEANQVKIRCWIQSILKMTHFLLPVGGAITLTPNSHIYAIGIIQQTNHWSLIKIRQCMWMWLGISCFSFLTITSSPRPEQTVWDIKNPFAI